VDDLPTLLRTASDDAPPTIIDVDAMIAAEGRRRRRTNVLSTVAAATAVLVTAGLSVTLLGRPHSKAAPPAAVTSPAPPSPGVNATPCTHATMPDFVPTREPFHPARGPLPETAEVASRRLTTALPALLPRGAHAKRCDRVEFFLEPKNRAYEATAWVGSGKDEYSLAFMITPTETGTVPRCLNDGPSCTRTDRPDGTVAMADLVGLATGRPQRSVTVFRPDGTTVLLAVIGRDQVLPSAAQLTAIGRAPGLTLYP
jgi:hypothetical protein